MVFMKPLPWILFVFCLVYAFVTLRSLSSVIPFHPDEFYFIDHAYSLDILQKVITNHTVITDRHAFVQPRLGEYIWALALRMQGHADVSAYLREIGFRTGNDEQGESYWQWQERTAKYFNDPKFPASASERKRIQPIVEARKMAILFAVAILAVAFFIGVVTNGWVGGFAIFWILLSNGLFQNSVLRAMGDGPLIFFMLAHFLLSLLYVRMVTRRRVLRFITLVGLAVTLGAAVSVKLNGLLSVVYFIILWVILKKNALILLTTVVGSFFIFVVLHPVLWGAPIENSFTMISYRMQLIQTQQSLFFQQALWTVVSRIEAVIKNVFYPGTLYGNFPAGKYGLPVSLDVPFYLIGFVVLVMCAVDYIKTTGLRKNTLSMITFLCWSLIITVGTTMNLPFDWDRYYLPVVIAVSFMQSFGIVVIIRTSLIIINHISIYIRNRKAI